MTKLRTIAIPVTGMHCAACASTITKRLKTRRGISDVAVVFAAAAARVTFDPSLISPDQIARQIVRAGFGTMLASSTIILRSTPDQKSLPVLQSTLESFEGVFSFDLDQFSTEITLRINPDIISTAELNMALRNNGFAIERTIADTDNTDVQDKKNLREQRLRLLRWITAFSVSLPLMLNMYITHNALSIPVLVCGVIPVFLFVSYPIYRTAFQALLGKNLTMEVMYALGITTAFCASLASTIGITGSHHFMLYDTAIMLTGFMTFGRYLEIRARGKTGDAIKKLIALQPATATIEDNGKLREVPVEDVTVGQSIVIRPGDRIPVDGKVISGSGNVDESMITGEPLPSVKQTGSNVTAGTINQTGVFKFTAERIGSATMLSAIIRMVRRAQHSRPPLQRIADIAVSLFIPVILVIALFAFTIWFFFLGSTFHFALTTLIAVLVVACPCALGLASPTAVTVGIGRGAQLGILIKNGDIFERTPGITTVVFDKTGTLTSGKPEVAAVEPVGKSANDLLHQVASLETCSTHPLATTIVKEAHRRNLILVACDDAVSINGKGITGTIDGRHLIAGNRALMRDEVIDITGIEATMTAFENRGMTTVVVAENGIVAGCIAITDTIKPSAKQAVTQLNHMGVTCTMLTGDTRRNAEAIAEQLGITEVRAEVLPGDKASVIETLQQSGAKVAFVGDGINDAPALAAADIGIALGSGTDIAIESADIVLVKGDPADAATALQLGRRVFGRIKGNLFWAFAYNFMLVPLAGGILYPFFSIMFKPEFAALAMALSSVTVVTRSLMLQRFVPEKTPDNTRSK